MTNGERLRQMTDEELAMWLCGNLVCTECPVFHKCNDFRSSEFSIEALKKWLKQESEDTE